MILPSKGIVGLLHNFDTFREYSIRYLLLDQLKVAVDLYRDGLGSSLHLVKHKSSPQRQDFNTENIPLNRVVNDTSILYVSAIALKLAAVFEQSAITIATELVQSLLNKQILPLHYSDKSLQIYTIQVVTPGWIHLHLTEQGIAAWLQYVLGTGNGEQGTEEAEGVGEWGSGGVGETRGTIVTFTSHQSTVTSQQSPVFRLQYVHARCCSLLRLGQRESLIKVSESPVWQILEPQPVPWFNDKGDFYLVNMAEVQLIAQILGLIDDISTSNQTNWIKLVDAFENFYSNCRMFGEVKLHQPQLAQARLALVMVVRSAIQVLLVKRLGILPPLEL